MARRWYHIWSLFNWSIDSWCYLPTKNHRLEVWFPSIGPIRKILRNDTFLGHLLHCQVLLGSDKGDSAGFTISGQWNPKDKAFLLLNSETPREEKIPLTVAVDLVVRGITEPVRLLVETHVKVFPKNERFWYFSRKTSLVQPFFLHLKEVCWKSKSEISPRNF